MQTLPINPPEELENEIKQKTRSRDPMLRRRWTLRIWAALMLSGIIVVVLLTSQLRFGTVALHLGTVQDSRQGERRAFNKMALLLREHRWIDKFTVSWGAPTGVKRARIGLPGYIFYRISFLRTTQKFGYGTTDDVSRSFGDDSWFPELDCNKVTDAEIAVAATSADPVARIREGSCDNIEVRS